MALLDHVGVKVTDLDRSIRFYSDLFGFEMVDRRMLGSSSVEAAAMEVGGSIIFLLHEASFQSRGSEEHGGVDHFCLTFTDAEFREILERIKAMGVRLEGGVVPRTGATGRSDSQYILDPDGNQIEVKTGLT
ncbi:MAG: VOC family protein [Deltaproteobacteria bacterium]|nr:VOC family protein [Deltaproteobacteria bacterium]